MSVTIEKAVMLALATGAAARMEPNVLWRERPAVAAYQALVALLQQRHPSVEWRILEIAPGSPQRQQLLAEQIQQSKAATEPAVLGAAQRVLQEVLRGVPQATVAIFAGYQTVSEALTAMNLHLEEKHNGTKSHARHSRHPARTAPPTYLSAL